LARIATGRRYRPLAFIFGFALIVLLAGTVSPAMGGPTTSAAAGSALKTAKRALGIAKQADRRSKLALKKAGTPGPTGPAGVPGARGSEGFDGADGARGPKGATGPMGPAGAKGATGAAGAKGATGADGAVGERGATGAGGPPGPTASRSVTIDSAVDISTSATVIDLSSGPLVTPFAGRLMATATVQVRNPSAAPSEGRCKLEVSDALDPGAGSSAISQTYAFDLPAQDGFDATITVSGAASKPAGTYNVSLVCSESGSESLSAERANLQVWAAD
jgi:hypothetical protein